MYIGKPCFKQILYLFTFTTKITEMQAHTIFPAPPPSDCWFMFTNPTCHLVMTNIAMVNHHFVAR